MSVKNLIKNNWMWVVGIFLLLGGISDLTSGNIVSGISIIGASLLTLPNTFRLLDSKVNGALSNNKLRVILAIAFFFLGVQLSPSKTSEQVNTTPTQVTQSDAVESKEEVETENDVEPVNNEEIGTIVSISDGDTLRVLVGTNEMNIRLIGIDTPEIHHQDEPIQCYGVAAKQGLSNLILNKEVRLEKDVSDVDKYDRYLRYIWIGDTLVNEYMTKNGYAMASSYPPDTKYQDLIDTGEKYAKDNLIGFWAKENCDGNVYTGTYKDPKVNQETAIQEPVKTTASGNTNIAPIAPVTNTNTNNKYACDCKKTCAKMSSCEEAQYQLNVCGCAARDGDDDGIACDSDCQ